MIMDLKGKVKLMNNAGKTTREKLLFAAIDLFSEKGYEATTVEEIAASVGMKGPNVYNYFKGKKGLVDAIDTLFKESYKEKMKLKECYAEPIQNAEDLKRFSMKTIRYTLNDEITRKLRRIATMEQYKSDYFRGKVASNQHSNIIQFFTGLMARLMEQGKIKKCDPHILALMYAAPVSQLIQIYDREPQRKSEILKTAEAYVDLFIDTYFIKEQ